MRDWLGKAVGTEAEDLSCHDKWLCPIKLFHYANAHHAKVDYQDLEALFLDFSLE
jgi:hypothetical protein